MLLSAGGDRLIRGYPVECHYAQAITRQHGDPSASRALRLSVAAVRDYLLLTIDSAGRAKTRIPLLFASFRSMFATARCEKALQKNPVEKQAGSI